MNLKRFVNVVLSCTVFSLFGFVADAFGQNTLTVNIDSAKIVVSKLIFGGLIEQTGRTIQGGLWVGTTSTVENSNGMRKDIIDAIRDAGFECLQFPGGCFGNKFEWSPPNPANDIGIDRFMQLCSLTTCIPYITVPSTSDKAQHNYDMVKYINENPSHPDWALNYVKVGNEVWGGCGNAQTEPQYVQNYLANYNLLKNPVNGKKMSIVAGTGLYSDLTWMDNEVKALVGKVDGLEYHNYVLAGYPPVIPSVNFNDSQYHVILHEAYSHVEGQIKQVCNILDKYDPDKTVKIFEDEWGDWLKPLDGYDAADWAFQQNSVMDVLSCVIQLNTFINHCDRVKLASLAQMINVIHSIVLTRPKDAQGKTDGKMIKTPTFYLMQMYKPHHMTNAKLIPTTLQCGNYSTYGLTTPAISAAASVDSVGRVHISLCNIDLVNPKTLTIKLNGSTTYGKMSGQIVTGPEKNSINDFDKPEQVNLQTFAATNYSLTGKTCTVTLPAKSAVMLTFEPSVGIYGKSTIQRDFFSAHVRSGKIVIDYSVAKKRQVTAALYGLDGRLVAGPSLMTMIPGEKCATLQPAGNVIRSNSYLLKLTDPSGSMSRLVVLAK